MKELGNSKGAIPFYAIYGPGLEQPITAAGPISSGWVYESLEKAKDSSHEGATTTRTEEGSATQASLAHTSKGH